MIAQESPKSVRSEGAEEGHYAWPQREGCATEAGEEFVHDKGDDASHSSWDLRTPSLQVEEMFAALGPPSSVTSVSFCDAFLGNEGCVKVAERARMSECLVKLDLKGNSISLEGCQALGDMLRVNRSLEFISLEWNNIGAYDAAVRALADGLETNHSLTELDLRNNAIGPQGGASLARALSRNTGLKTLDLRWNEIGASGGRALASALSDKASLNIKSGSRSGNRALLELKLGGNNVSVESLEIIGEALKRNRHPEAQITLGEARLADLAARLRASDENVKRPHRGIQSKRARRKLQQLRKKSLDEDGVDKSTESKEECANQEDLSEDDNNSTTSLDSDLKELERAYQEQDSLVFADRVIELEIELKACADASATAQKEADEERVKATEAQARADNCEQKLASAQEIAERMKSQLETERKRTEATAQARLQATSEAGKLATELGRIKASLEEVTRDLEQEKEERQTDNALRIALAGQLEEIRAGKRALAERQKEAAAQAARDQEASLKKELDLQKSLDELREKHAEEVATMKQRLNEEMAARATEAREAATRLASERQKLEDAMAAAEVKAQANLDSANDHVRTRADAQLERMRKKHELEIARMEAKATAAEERHAKALEDLEAKQKNRVSDAVTQAVESELGKAVRHAVKEAAQELEEEHKREMWRFEREITDKVKEASAKNLDFVKQKAAEEQEILQTELNLARAKVLELQTKHAAQVSSLKERMRQAVTETFA